MTVRLSTSGLRYAAWDDAASPEEDFKRFSPEQAAEFRSRHPTVSPWWVVLAQAVIAVLMALTVWWVTGAAGLCLSMLYGSAVVVVPGALLARGITGRPAGMAAASRVVSFMVWQLVKVSLSVVMLMLAPKIVQPLSWPALLAAMAVCLQVYWFALLWRGRRLKNGII